VSFQLVRARKKQPEETFNKEEVLLRAKACFREAQCKDLRGIVREKIDQLQHYDVLGMDRVTAILSWGRSGSLLLASYLDGHDDVLMLPETDSQSLYYFFEHYPSLSLRDKLTAYPAFRPNYPHFFDGDFAISPEQYYAAVEAILEVYGKWKPEFLESRRAFFLFVHIAYNLALGRRPRSAHPMIVYQQHFRDNALARNLVEDFPQTKFVHTVRDPISSCDGVFHYHFTFVETSIPNQRFLPTVAYTARYFLSTGRPHSGMTSRTRTIRFEDLHRDTAGTLSDLSDWLGLSCQPVLLESTFNGIPYVVVRRDGKAWSGPRLEPVQRDSRYLSRKDRALMFAVFYENFVAWNYPCPKVFGNAIVRFIVFVALVLIPTEMEVVATRALFKCGVLPAVRRGNIRPVAEAALEVGLCRLKMVRVMMPGWFGRWADETTLLEVTRKKAATGAPTQELQAAK
jgi:hypothetical protein